MSGATPDTTYDSVVQFVDWGGHTVTVDPINKEPWIHNGGDERHSEAVEKGRADRKAAYLNTAAAVRAMEPTKAYVKTFLPGAKDLLSAGPVKRPGIAAYTENGAVAPFDHEYKYRQSAISDPRPALRPIVEQLHRDQQLPDSDKYELDRVFRDAQAAVDRRVLER
jgi:hypothetical protein